MRILLLPAVCVVSLAPCDLAEAATLKTIVGSSGRCTRLVVAGRDMTPECDGKILNTAYADGRTGFYFVTKDGLAVTFSGPGDRQTKADADSATIPIDLVIVGRGGKSEAREASGTCRFVNPYKGPAPVSCRATAGADAYVGEFLTDGSEPKRDDF